jgi:hypothetical protein
MLDNVSLGKFQVNLDVAQHYGKTEKIRLFKDRNPDLFTWIAENIDPDFDRMCHRIKLISWPFRTYDEVTVYLEIRTESELTLWKLRPDNLASA